MSSTRSTDRFTWLNFRVLIIGRANAGKTTILQRVCDTTDSPKVYRVIAGSRQEIQLESTAERGKHNIDDELIFSNHGGYIFHDSCGFECGGEEELKIVQKFVSEKATAKRLKDRLHAIWYCIPMDGERPSLDLKYFNSICLDKNVPIIAVFTKYDQFKLDIEFKLEDIAEDSGCDKPGQNIIDAEAKKCFEEEYLGKIEGAPRHVQLENMNNPGKHCDALIEVTAEALQDDTIAVMFLAVQKGKLENTMLVAAKWTTSYSKKRKRNVKNVLNKCVFYFPLLWNEFFDEFFLDDELNEFNELNFFDMDFFDSLMKSSHCLSSLFQMATSSALKTDYQTMIAAILVLDLASILQLEKPYQDVKDSLHLAYLQGEEYGVFIRILETFPGTHEDYAIESCNAFILQNRLSKPDQVL